MSNGLNEKFSANPWRFMIDHVVLAFPGLPMNEIPAQGLCELDLRRRQTGIIAIEPFAISRTAGDSKRLNSYWLPWTPGETVTAYLGADTQADYFFTSDLGGCRVMISPASGNRIAVAHIAGDRSQGSHDKSGSLWRSAQALVHATSLAQGLGTTPGNVQTRSRALTSTGRSLFAPPSRNRGYGLVGIESGSTVIGRKRHNGSWEFWYQVYHSTMDGMKLDRIDQLWP